MSRMETKSQMSKSKRGVGSPSHALSEQEISILQEPDFHRKRGERVDEALYRDYEKRQARHKLIDQTVSS